MLTLIVYQVKSEKIRNKLRKILLNYGYSIQNSVFEFRLTTEQRQQLIGKVTSVKSDLCPEDSIRIYQVCRSCLAKVVIIGNKPLTSDPLFYIA